MVGKYQIQITGNQFAQGLCTSDYLGDGGIGTSSTNLSLIGTPGTVRATPVTSASGTIPTSETIIASCEDPSTSSSQYSKVVVTDNGSFATVATTTNATLNTFASDGTHSGYVSGVTDMASFMGYAFATRQTDIAKYDLSGPTVTSAWWTGAGGSALSGNSRHPLLAFEGFLWVGDAYKLRSIASDLTTFANPLSLNTNERIVALGIDPNTGLMMVAVRTVYSTADDIQGQSFVYLYDGYSSKTRRKIAVDAPVWGFEPVGGQLYVGYGNCIGVWNGAGISFLRRLTNNPGASTAVPNRMRLSHFHNTLLVVDNNNAILAYGDIVGGKKVWQPLYNTSAGAKNIALITNLGNDSTSTIPESPLILATGGSQIATVVRPLDTVSVGSGVFYTNNIYFERPVNIRRMRVYTTGITTTAGLGGVALIDEKGTVNTPAVSTFVVASGTKYVFDFDFNLECNTLQPKITLGTQAFGIVRVVIYYDVVQ